MRVVALRVMASSFMMLRCGEKLGAKLCQECANCVSSLDMDCDLQRLPTTSMCIVNRTLPFTVREQENERSGKAFKPSRIE